MSNLMAMPDPDMSSTVTCTGTSSGGYYIGDQFYPYYSYWPYYPESKIEKAFKVAKVLQDKGYVKFTTVKKFIEFIDDISKEL